MTVTLYYDSLSGPARSIINFLNFHKDETVVRKVVSLFEKQQLEQWFIDINPHHTVPTLTDDETGVTLYESVAILQYLAEKLNVTGKYGLPTDVKAKWTTINALHNQHNFISKANGEIMGPFFRAFRSGQPLEVDVLKAGLEAAKPKYAVLEALLAERGGYLAGSTPTIADLRAWVDLFQVANIGGASTLELYDFSESYPHIQKWLVAIKEDLFDEEVWKGAAGLLEHAAGVFGGPVFRLAKKD